ncbi:MAG: ion transporter [Flavobacteriaceae bacterium]|nr:ion transporter [Flavobacteriaceae bacterium]
MRREHNLIPEEAEWKKKVFRIIYFAETPLGKLFDVVLLGMIVLSALIVVMDSVENIRFHKTFLVIEWFMNIIFTAEYIVRVMVVKNKKDYIFSMMGIIDLLSILPFYIGIFAPEAKYLMIIRLFRLLRVFRILNMMDYMDDGHYILQSLRSSSRKIYIFLMFITIIVVVLGALMHIIEGGKNGFHNIPVSIYWAVVTITTVGYGDISPVTPLGKLLSMVLMLCGYSIIAVPTGIVSSHMRKCMNKTKKPCDRCGNIDNDDDARYCKQCGQKIVEESP